MRKKKCLPFAGNGRVSGHGLGWHFEIRVGPVEERLPALRQILQHQPGRRRCASTVERRSARACAGSIFHIKTVNITKINLINMKYTVVAADSINRSRVVMCPEESSPRIVAGDKKRFRRHYFFEKKFSYYIIYEYRSTY